MSYDPIADLCPDCRRFSPGGGVCHDCEGGDIHDPGDEDDGTDSWLDEDEDEDDSCLDDLENERLDQQEADDDGLTAELMDAAQILLGDDEPEDDDDLDIDPDDMMSDLSI